jgi:hypothetical protein
MESRAAPNEGSWPEPPWLTGLVEGSGGHAGGGGTALLGVGSVVREGSGRLISGPRQQQFL